jgi:hypothetical protein
MLSLSLIPVGPVEREKVKIINTGLCVGPYNFPQNNNHLPPVMQPLAANDKRKPLFMKSPCTQMVNYITHRV